MESTTITALTTFAALILVVGLIFGFVWLMKRLNDMPMQLGKTKRQRSITVLESRMLDPKNRLHHIVWQGRDYLIASGPMGTRLVAGTPANTPATTGQSFADMIDMQDGTKEPNATSLQAAATAKPHSVSTQAPSSDQHAASHKPKGQTI